VEGDTKKGQEKKNGDRSSAEKEYARKKTKVAKLGEMTPQKESGYDKKTSASLTP